MSPIFLVFFPPMSKATIKKYTSLEKLFGDIYHTNCTQKKNYKCVPGYNKRNTSLLNCQKNSFVLFAPWLILYCSLLKDRSSGVVNTQTNMEQGKLHMMIRSFY